MAKITTSDFQKGMFILYRDEPHQIVGLEFVNPGKGSAFVRTKLKHLKTGRVGEFTYKSGETVEEYPVYVREMQFLYATDTDVVFMDKENYEQLHLSKEIVGPFHRYLKEGETYQVQTHEGIALGMRYPKKVTLKITTAEDAVRGSTVSGAKKQVTLETGVEIAVPLFIKAGDSVAVDPETGEYVERVSQT